MTTPVDFIRNCIRTQRHMGLYPTELHMADQTFQHFKVDAGSELKTSKVTDTRSLLARVRGSESGRADIYQFDDVRVVINPDMPEGPIILRPRQLMDDPNWLRHVNFRPEPEGILAMPKEGTPWIQPAPAEEAATPADVQARDSGALEMLSKVSGVTPTSILMKAMEGMDSTKDLVVLRFKHNGDIDMCSTFDRYGIVGGLQAALTYVMRGGE